MENFYISYIAEVPGRAFLKPGTVYATNVVAATPESTDLNGTQRSCKALIKRHYEHKEGADASLFKLGPHSPTHWNPFHPELNPSDDIKYNKLPIATERDGNDNWASQLMPLNPISARSRPPSP
ncbi:hypothetical protein FS837_012783 [Tulasnella sp. UAMH 9824]|nr:hypothetical protein FS837_012783 [Tulasnella sp. UAMH 9824]